MKKYVNNVGDRVLGLDKLTPDLRPPVVVRVKNVDVGNCERFETPWYKNFTMTTFKNMDDLCYLFFIPVSYYYNLLFLDVF